ncbi:MULTISPECIES: hypothetical protein [Cyanophyceae]|uniref:hypothetical protein n=1 Tax=Cyanophyceae TaxID=3028117 RepID=UPI0016883B57|nr:hypothetical protein [Trichocoleus sp. FACHB-40]MBD2002330.1 hypothetical protein [Trichocoleus sp. FACHB-40]
MKSLNFFGASVVPRIVHAASHSHVSIADTSSFSFSGAGNFNSVCASVLMDLVGCLLLRRGTIFDFLLSRELTGYYSKLLIAWL